MLVCLLALTACQDEPNSKKSSVETITVNGVSFNMVKVKGGPLTQNMEFLLGQKRQNEVPKRQNELFLHV